MKAKTYRTNKVTCKSYITPVGKGWEVGFVYGNRPIFVGNFIHRPEANNWYAIMNRYIRTFSRRYTVAPNCPTTWFGSFLGSYLYRCYYQYVNSMTARYNKTYQGEVTRNVRTYRRLTRQWEPGERCTYLKAA